MTGRHTYLHDPHTLSFFTFSCHQQKPLFSDPHLSNILVNRLRESQDNKGCSIIAWVIMPEHVHLLVHLPEIFTPTNFLRYVKQPVSYSSLKYLESNFQELYQSLGVPSGRKWNHRFWMKGGGFHRNLYSMDRVRSAIEYIHNNPVEEAYVQHPEEWKYSSAGWWLTSNSDVLILKIPDWLGIRG